MADAAGAPRRTPRRRSRGTARPPAPRRSRRSAPSAPHHWVEEGIAGLLEPAAGHDVLDHGAGGDERGRRPPGPSTRWRRPATSVHTSTAPRTSTEPGSTGTRTPTSPTRMTSATQTSSGLTPHTLARPGRGNADGPGHRSGAVGSTGGCRSDLALGGDGRGVGELVGLVLRRWRRSLAACRRAPARGGRRRGVRRRSGAPHGGRPGLRTGHSGPRRSARRGWGQLQWSHRPHF